MIEGHLASRSKRNIKSNDEQAQDYLDIRVNVWSHTIPFKGSITQSILKAMNEANCSAEAANLE